MLFLSHTWKEDTNGRNTHNRVREVRDALHALNIKTWFDEDFMVDDVDACMANGIERSSVVCVFITRQYCEKVDAASRNPSIRDNCYKEFSYAQISGKPCLSIVFDECMLDVTKWPAGIVKLYLGSKLYINGTGDDMTEVARNITETLKRQSGRTPEYATSSPRLRIPKRHRKAPVLYVRQTQVPKHRLLYSVMYRFLSGARVAPMMSAPNVVTTTPMLCTD